MSTSAYILAAGKFRPEIIDLLDFPVSCYAKATSETRVFAHLFQVVTADQNRDLCTAIRVDPCDAATWQVKLPACDLETLAELGVRIASHFDDAIAIQRLHTAGFSLFYFPE